MISAKKDSYKSSFMFKAQLYKIRLCSHRWEFPSWWPEVLSVVALALSPCLSSPLIAPVGTGLAALWIENVCGDTSTVLGGNVNRTAIFVSVMTIVSLETWRDTTFENETTIFLRDFMFKSIHSNIPWSRPSAVSSISPIMHRAFTLSWSLKWVKNIMYVF